MARLHTGWFQRPNDWPASFERIDGAFWQRALGEFVPAQARVAQTRTSGQAELLRRALQAAESLFDDPLQAVVDRFAVTVLHGDLYGQNVLQRDDNAKTGTRAYQVIDWNSARVGPAMFDVAMGGYGYDTPEVQSYLRERNRLGFPAEQARFEYAWNAVLISAMYAPVQVNRGDLELARWMVEHTASELAVARRLLG